MSSKHCGAADSVDIVIDDGQLRVATHQCVEGLLTESQAYVAEPLPFPSLMFTVTHRLRSSLALLLGHAFYPNAVSVHNDPLNPGPLAAGSVVRRYDCIVPSIPPLVWIPFPDCPYEVVRDRSSELASEPRYIYVKPLAHVAAVETTLAIAKRYCEVYDDISTKLPFGIIAAHNVTEAHLKRALKRLRDQCILATTEDV